MTPKAPAENGVFHGTKRFNPLWFEHIFTFHVSRFTLYGFTRPHSKMQLMGCFPDFLKAMNLINYINRTEIVKNFTNFTCGVCERAL
jgi:hypothetical protein